MGQKDRTEKYLESYNDVFADIFNVLVFRKKWICEEKLRSVEKESIYKAETGDLRLQERDVLKEYENNRLLVAALGIENQSTIDRDMPVRVMGYDYATYREQIDKDRKRVPVVTIVLNFSKTKWKSPLALKDILEIPEEMENYVQDYKVHVFNIAHLPKEVRNQFTSDFKIVADYFSEKDNPDYQPSREKIKHVEAVLELLRVFTDDKRYDTIKQGVIENERKGGVTMCTLLDRVEERGIRIGEKLGEKRGIQIGEARGKEEERQLGIKILVSACRSLCVSEKMAQVRIMEGYGMTEKEAEEVVAKYW